MARCTNDVLLNKIGFNKLDKNDELSLRVRRDLPDCRKINAKNYFQIAEGASESYSKYDRPDDLFECNREGCVNSGTLKIATAAKAVDYFIRHDATEFAAGILTFYTRSAAAATLTVTISDSAEFTNADVYTVSIPSTTAPEFHPVMIDMSQTPTSVEGNGWEASENGAYIRFSSSGADFELSSIAIFDSLEEFELNDVVKVSCLTSVGGSYDVSLVEEACNAARYDDTITSLQFPFTGTRVTPNYWKLNPLLSRGDNGTGFDLATVKKTVIAGSGAISSYGTIVLPDLNQEVCGFITAQVADACDVTDAHLNPVSAPAPVDLNPVQFQVIGTNVLVHSSLIGQELLISYPIEVEIEEWVANPDTLNDVHVSLVWRRETSDGVKYVDIFENVFVTSFPATITNTEATFAFTLTVSRDKDGNFFRQQRILGDAAASIAESK